MKIICKNTFIVFFCFLFIACSNKRLDTSIKYPKLPKNFNKTTQNNKLDEKWLSNLKDKRLIGLITKALEKNFDLQQLSYDIKIREKELIASKSYLLPTIDLTANTNKSANFDGDKTPSTQRISLQMQYTIDLWGKLSDSSKASNMKLLESKALYEEAKQQLIADVSLIYFEIIEANKLLKLYQKNLQTSKEYYDLILSRYKQGISEALDTLLAQNSIFTQKSKITNLKTSKAQAIFKLEELLGTYPKGELDIKKEFPIIKDKIKLGIPSNIIEKKPSIAASWNALLSKNYELAFAHKQRLPSLNITASLENMKNNGSSLSWSLLAGLTAPIFSAGELKANEDISYYELKKAELEYLNTIYSSLVEIESLIQEQKDLEEEYKILKDTNSNAKNSLQLSFNQYLKGLIEYTTVLEQQENLYNTQESLIKIKRALIENKINLHKALGGDFNPLKKQ